MNIVTITFGAAVPYHGVGHNFRIDFIWKTMKRFVRCWCFACLVQKIPAGVYKCCNNHLGEFVHCQRVGHNFKIVLIGKTMERFVRCWCFACPIQKIPAGVCKYCNYIVNDVDATKSYS